ncbi:MAG: lipocalin family protein [Ignavibacteriaceae bacterium]
MKNIFIILLLLCPAFLIIAQDKKNSEPSTVKYVDLNKYTGTWYEIAKIPNWFQEDCIKNTTASYKLNEDGEIEVINRCLEEDGNYDEADGTAVVVDKKSNSKLEVSFVKILGINLFWGDYWIIGLDDNYQYAVIGTPTRKYGWILSRQAQMPEEDLNEAYTILRKQGYNPDDFEMTKQDKR